MVANTMENGTMKEINSRINAIPVVVQLDQLVALTWPAMDVSIKEPGTMKVKHSETSVTVVHVTMDMSFVL
jgi:hypothetical protein